MSTVAAPVERAPNQGPMERKDPVPAGRYWLYITTAEVPRWDEWVKEHADRVQVIATEAQEALSSWLPMLFVTRPDLSIITNVEGYWVLFDVLQPVPWVGLGYPTHVIDPSVQSATDISTAPPPAPDSSPWDTVATLTKLAGWGLGAYLAIQGFALLRPLLSKGRSP